MVEEGEALGWWGFGIRSGFCVSGWLLDKASFRGRIFRWEQDLRVGEVFGVGQAGKGKDFRVGGR